MSDSVAILHDQFRTLGGAERVCIELARTFDAPVFTMRVDEGIVPDDVEVHEIAGKYGKRLMRHSPISQDVYQMFAWQLTSAVDDYETIIENKTNPWWYVPQTEQTIIRYVHSPPRGPYDQFHRVGGGVLGTGIKTAMRTLFQQTLPYADAWLCNSDVVARRTNRYLGVPESDIDVVYPPVSTHHYGRAAASTGDYYVTISRLSRNKRLPQIVDAFRGTNRQLVIAGDGERREELEEATADCPNVELRGYVSESEKCRLLAEAKAFIMNAEQEDFGMSPIEAFAAGTPVIGVNEGMTQYQVQDGANGIRYERGPASLRGALSRFEREGVEWGEETIEGFADLFGTERFRVRAEECVRAAQDAAAISPAFEREQAGGVETDPALAEVLADGGDAE